MSGRPPDDAAATIDVLFVVAAHSLLLDLAGPAEALRLTNQYLRRQGRTARFRLRYAGPDAVCPTSVGLAVTGIEPLPDALEAPTWIVLVGQPSDLPDAATRTSLDACDRWLGTTAAQLLADPTHRLVTICAGTLHAARAGLPGARRCTTHHELLDELKACAPAAQVIDNRVFVVDGRLASSAGITAGIDLTLHLIAEVCGDAVSATIARNMVVYLRRTPNDPELSPLLAHRHHLHPVVHRVQDAVCADPTRDWTMSALADAGHVTERHLLRLFMTHASLSPLHYLQAIRLERARQSLLRGATVGRAAEDAGFSSDLQLRRAWGKRYAGSPREVRAP